MAVKVVAVDPVLTVARSARDAADPASITYDIGAFPTGALHDKVNERPLTDDCNDVGAGGAPQACGTLKLTSFDAALVPVAFCALTRAK